MVGDSEDIMEWEMGDSPKVVGDERERKSTMVTLMTQILKMAFCQISDFVMLLCQMKMKVKVRVKEWFSVWQNIWSDFIVLLMKLMYALSSMNSLK